ncbi:MAG: hypothetical protein ACYS30_12265, partial [Planctomycetota bacterium]
MTRKRTIILLVAGLCFTALPQVSYWMSYEFNPRRLSCIVGLIELVLLVFVFFSYPLGTAIVLFVAVRGLLRGPLASPAKLTHRSYSALIVPLAAN